MCHFATIRLHWTGAEKQEEAACLHVLGLKEADEGRQKRGSCEAVIGRSRQTEVEVKLRSCCLGVWDPENQWRKIRTFCAALPQSGAILLLLNPTSFKKKTQNKPNYKAILPARHTTSQSFSDEKLEGPRGIKRIHLRALRRLPAPFKDLPP